jgi:UDP-glucuronate 4-epimerase
MKILVTGAAGFIGSHLCDRLLAEGHIVVGIDNFDPFYKREVKERNLGEARKHPRYSLVESDIRDGAGMERMLAECGIGTFDVIAHLAAKAGIRPSIDDPVGYQLTNIVGTQNVLEFARKTGVKQFVFASSSSVYGLNPKVPWREDDHVLLPISPYASTKVSGELLGHVYAHLYGIRFLALRFFTVYGPRQRPDLAIHKFARLMLAGQPIPVFGDGMTGRDYTYVGDIVSGILSAMRYQATQYEVINLGNSCIVSLHELIARLETCLQRKAILDPKPAQPGDLARTCADVAKARRLVGYAPKTSLENGLAQFAQWLAVEARRKAAEETAGRKQNER